MLRRTLLVSSIVICLIVFVRTARTACSARRRCLSRVHGDSERKHNEHGLTAADHFRDRRRYEKSMIFCSGRSRYAAHLLQPIVAHTQFWLLYITQHRVLVGGSAAIEARRRQRSKGGRNHLLCAISLNQFDHFSHVRSSRSSRPVFTAGPPIGRPSLHTAQH